MTVLALRLVAVSITVLLTVQAHARTGLVFEIERSPALTNAPLEGRLFVVLSRTNSPEPRLALGRAGSKAPDAFARDIEDFAPGKVVLLNETSFGYPTAHMRELKPGNYFFQALFAVNRDLNFPNAPGALYSEPREVSIDPGNPKPLKVDLLREVPPEQLPPDSAQLRFLRLPSPLLSRFHGRPMFLRAGIILPRDYEADPSRRYPLWVRIGGLSTRYTVVSRLMGERSEFRKTWQAPETPRFILLQLDGAGPYGDPYYVNSANNGPYGDALVKELIPEVEKRFRTLGQSRGRVLSGVSTGGWVALALQVFYPDFFNGTWSSCPDPVDFRALELLDIYRESNAYLNQFGNERPSERNLNGDVVLTMRQEVGAENLLGRGNSYTLSGDQWGAWNAVFGPRGPDGKPVALWDPATGTLNPAVAEQWRRYDLREVLERNWHTLGPKLRGKLHIAAGESDQYFLNNAVHLLDDFLAHAEPPFEGRIVYGPRKLHGWSDVELPQMLQEMQKATGR